MSHHEKPFTWTSYVLALCVTGNVVLPATNKKELLSTLGVRAFTATGFLPFSLVVETELFERMVTGSKPDSTVFKAPASLA